VFTALTRPLADFERAQAAAALPSITEQATLRRIAEQAAVHAEQAASKAPPDQAQDKQAEAIARAAEAANLVVPPVPRWLVDDATPGALAGLLNASCGVHAAWLSSSSAMGCCSGANGLPICDSTWVGVMVWAHRSASASRSGRT
jgi:Protein of unknown function (DUF3987)